MLNAVNVSGTADRNIIRHQHNHEQMQRTDHGEGDVVLEQQFYKQQIVLLECHHQTLRQLLLSPTLIPRQQ